MFSPALENILQQSAEHCRSPDAYLSELRGAVIAMNEVVTQTMSMEAQRQLNCYAWILCTRCGGCGCEVHVTTHRCDIEERCIKLAGPVNG